MWCGLFRWQRKWLNAEKDLSSSAVDSFAMNLSKLQVAAYFKYVTTNITSAEQERWLRTWRRLVLGDDHD